MPVLLIRIDVLPIERGLQPRNSDIELHLWPKKARSLVGEPSKFSVDLTNTDCTLTKKMGNQECEMLIRIVRHTL